MRHRVDGSPFERSPSLYSASTARGGRRRSRSSRRRRWRRARPTSGRARCAARTRTTRAARRCSAGSRRTRTARGPARPTTAKPKRQSPHTAVLGLRLDPTAPGSTHGGERAEAHRRCQTSDFAPSATRGARPGTRTAIRLSPPGTPAGAVRVLVSARGAKSPAGWRGASPVAVRRRVQQECLFVGFCD